MAEDRYQKGLDNLKELTVPDSENPTGHMDIGEGFKDIAPDLRNYVVEFAFGDIYSRPGIDNKQKVITTISALVRAGTPQLVWQIDSRLTVGLTPEVIVGCIMHLIGYTGFPRALNALKAAHLVSEEKAITVKKDE